MDKALFYKTVRAKLGKLDSDQVAGFETILDVIARAPLSHQAYMLATVWHETAKTMQPVREAFNLSENWRKNHLRYWPHYGRGYVQITWDYNYRKAEAELVKEGYVKPGELMANLDLAMRHDIAAFIMLRGMVLGWFTGKKLSSYLPDHGVATREQYMAARRIINGTDKADLIEDHAQVFERALRDAGVV